MTITNEKKLINKLLKKYGAVHTINGRVIIPDDYKIIENSYYLKNKEKILINQKRNRILKKYGGVIFRNGEYTKPSYFD